MMSKPSEEIAYNFIHIPKCGGSTLNHILRKTFGPSNVFHAGNANETQCFRNMDQKQLFEFKCVGGHIPGPDFVQKGLSESIFLCIVRDPIKQFVSYYNDIKTRDGHPLHVYAQGNLEDFLEITINSPTHNTKNLHQCFWISGENSSTSALEFISSRDFFITDLSKFNEFYVYLCDFFSWEKTTWEKKNVRSDKQPDASIMSSKALVQLTNFFSEDLKFVEIVRQFKNFQA